MMLFLLSCVPHSDLAMQILQKSIAGNIGLYCTGGGVDIILIGFSTGAQSVTRFMREQSSARKSVKAVILLSPVSDYEWFQEMNKNLHVGLYDKYEKQAQAMKPEASFYECSQTDFCFVYKKTHSLLV